MIAAGLLAMLALAWRLEPNSRGMGTHQQLGLPPCTAIVLWGKRCPACGMTTSWAYLMEGRPLASWTTNAGGFVFAMISLVTAPWLAVLGYRGQKAADWHVTALAIAMVAALAVTFADWVWRLNT